jgi:SAM-dependent methyltransferase
MIVDALFALESPWLAHGRRGLLDATAPVWQSSDPDLWAGRRRAMRGRSQLKTFLNDMWTAAMDLNRANILDCVPHNAGQRLLDLGCDDGAWTMQLAAQANTANVSGVEIVPERAAAAEQRGVHVIRSDLAQRLPFPDASFDLLHANQVIEHVPDVDLFVSEIVRVLRPGGRAVLSSENGSSWVNIGAAILGWQIFSLTNVSARRGGIGNPLALHRGEQDSLVSWTHKTIFNYRGLVELCEAYGLRVIRVLGAGYFPFHAGLGRLDPRHAHFLTVSCVRTER